MESEVSEQRTNVDGQVRIRNGNVSAQCDRHGIIPVPDAVIRSSYYDAYTSLQKKPYVGTVILHLVSRKNMIFCVASKSLTCNLFLSRMKI